MTRYACRTEGCEALRYEQTTDEPGFCSLCLDDLVPVPALVTDPLEAEARFTVRGGYDFKTYATAVTAAEAAHWLNYYGVPPRRVYDLEPGETLRTHEDARGIVVTRLER